MIFYSYLIVFASGVSGVPGLLFNYKNKKRIIKGFEYRKWPPNRPNFTSRAKKHPWYPWNPWLGLVNERLIAAVSSWRLGWPEISACFDGKRHISAFSFGKSDRKSIRVLSFAIRALEFTQIGKECGAARHYRERPTYTALATNPNSSRNANPPISQFLFKKPSDAPSVWFLAPSGSGALIHQPPLGAFSNFFQKKNCSQGYSPRDQFRASQMVPRGLRKSHGKTVLAGEFFNPTINIPFGGKS